MNPVSLIKSIITSPVMRGLFRSNHSVVLCGFSQQDVQQFMSSLLGNAGNPKNESHRGPQGGKLCFIEIA